MSIDVSIIVPVYNSQKYIKKCIESILNQDKQEFELILINDGSTDNSYEICKRYSEYDNRILVIDKHNTGSADTRNLGIDLAKGEYICFIDSDDWIETNMISETYKLAIENNSDMIISGMNIDRVNCLGEINSQINNYKFSIWNNVEQIKNNVINLFPTAIINSSCNKLYRTEILQSKNIRFPKTNVGEDTLFNIDVLANINRMIVTDKSYYHYMRYEDEITLTNRTIKGSFKGYINIHNRMNQLFINWGNFDNEIESKINETMFCQYFATILKILSTDNKYSYKIKKRMLDEGLKEEIITNTFKYNKPYSIKERIFRRLIINRLYFLSIISLKIKKILK